ncbi:MAG: ferritin-like domain-containing protein, partial [Oscillochloris sp.]|nr:ferritin-like domain-containing protein [Oscillochloris sp.]
MATPKDTLISWLKDAHSMESSVIQTLEQHADAAKDHPQVQARIREHLEESRTHAALVEGCLKSYGETTSGLKETVGRITGFMQGIAPDVAPDTLVKNTLVDYSTEYFEMACYRSLISAAKYLGDSETARVCEQIISDEQRMADWLEQQIPTATQEFLAMKSKEV